MGKSKAEQLKWSQRVSPGSRDVARVRQDAGGAPTAPVPLVVPGVDAGASGIAALLASGQLTRLTIRYHGNDGCSITVKATSATGAPVYIHGEFSVSESLSSELDQVIDKGRWHYDRYAAKEEENHPRRGSNT